MFRIIIIHLHHNTPRRKQSMTPQIFTYVILIVSVLYVVYSIYPIFKAKKNNQEIVVRPIRIVAAVIVMILAIYAIATGNTYDSIIDAINTKYGR